jgi:hypothetical protein
MPPTNINSSLRCFFCLIRSVGKWLPQPSMAVAASLFNKSSGIDNAALTVEPEQVRTFIQTDILFKKLASSRIILSNSNEAYIKVGSDDTEMSSQGDGNSTESSIHGFVASNDAPVLSIGITIFVGVPLAKLSTKVPKVRGSIVLGRLYNHDQSVTLSAGKHWQEEPCWSFIASFESASKEPAGIGMTIAAPVAPSERGVNERCRIQVPVSYRWPALAFLCEHMFFLCAFFLAAQAAVVIRGGRLSHRNGSLRLQLATLAEKQRQSNFSCGCDRVTLWDTLVVNIVEN